MWLIAAGRRIRGAIVQGGNDGHDHHPNAFTMWMAGGRIKGGVTLGASNELGFNAVLDRVHVRDLHATILHLLGFNHKQLSFPAQGLDQRLTRVEPCHVVQAISSSL